LRFSLLLFIDDTTEDEELLVLWTHTCQKAAV